MADDYEAISVAGLPRRIDATDRPELARLAGFPVNIAFFGVHRTPDGKTSMASAVYRSDPDTYREDEDKREMLYFPEQRESGFRVSITFNRSRGIWSATKYRGDKWLGGGGGPNFETAMLGASQAGLVPGEGEALAGGSRERSE